jgi:hypothetical protein
MKLKNKILTFIGFYLLIEWFKRHYINKGRKDEKQKTNNKQLNMLKNANSIRSKPVNSRKLRKKFGRKKR